MERFTREIPSIGDELSKRLIEELKEKWNEKLKEEWRKVLDKVRKIQAETTDKYPKRVMLLDQLATDVFKNTGLVGQGPVGTDQAAREEKVIFDALEEVLNESEN